MATSAITPASAPAAAPASTPAPAAAPAAPASQPSTPASSIPGPEAPLEDRLSAGWTKALETVKAAEPAAEELPAPAPEETPAEPAVEEPASEQPAEEKTEEEPAEAAPAEEAPAAEEAAELDDGESLAPQAFAKELKADPAAEKFFNDHPELKNKVFAALRRDTENREIRQLVPDVETAKMVTTAAATYQNIDNKFLGATTPEGAQGFLSEWVKEAILVDEKGQPLLDANGQYQVHPALTYTFNHIFSNKLDVLQKQAEKSGDERLQAALDIIREVTAPSSPGKGDVPEDLKPYADSISAREREVQAKEEALSRQQREQQESANQQSIDRAETKAAESVQGQLKPLFAKANLSEFEQEAALTAIGEQIDAALKENKLYQSIYQSILQREPGEEREKALTKHMLSYASSILGPIATKVINRAKGGALARQESTQKKVAAQTTASKTEPRGTSITPASASPTNPKEVIASIRKDHPDWDTAQVMQEAFTRSQKPRR